jgi:hypothetical protein
MIMHQVLALAVISAVLTGCATVGSMGAAAADAGVKRDFAAACEQIRIIVPEVLMQASFMVRESRDIDHREQVVTATKAVSAFSWGELVRISISEIDSDVTGVRIHTERRLATNVTARRDWAPELFSAMEARLDDFE